MRTNTLLRSLGHVLATVALTLLAVILLFAVAIRPWYMNWGATAAEAAQTLPGDELLAHTDAQLTHAITINAPASAVWPWLVQMGQGHGGFYSYEMLENLLGCDMHNADTIVPAWQNTQVGDPIRMYPEGNGAPPFTAAEIIPGQALVTGHTNDPGGVPAQVTPQTEWNSTWSFILQPIDADSTRLLIRSRSIYADPVLNTIMTAVEPGAFIMERGMLQGIKERAERAQGLQVNYTASDGWSIAFLLLAFLGLTAYVFAGRWPQKLYIAPLGAILWLAAVFFGYPSLIFAALIALAAIVALIWNYLWPRETHTTPVQVTIRH